MELKLYIKQTQQFNAIGDPIVFVGPNPQSLVGVVNGALATNRQWPQFGNFIDVTPYVSDLFKLRLTWAADRDDNGAGIPGAAQTKKSASGTLTFEGEAYKLIKQWLFDDVSAPLNSVDVKIEHVGCGRYEDYQIKAADVTLCETLNNGCSFDVTLKQKDEALNCIKRTLVEDNWQQWFQQQPGHGKKHPRFSYCNEQRPNGLLVVMWYMLTLLVSILVPILAVLVLVVNIVLGVILMIVSVINTIINAINLLPGISIPTIPTQNLQPISFSDIIDGIANMYIESGGCGREHPAPLIRDYISNVCSKCKVEVDGTTAPIFFAQTMQVETSSRGIINVPNPHYNACYFNAPVKRGIRRFKSLSFGGLPANNTDFYIPDNSPLMTLDDFLDGLKKLYNAEWRLVNNKLYFQRKDYFLAGDYVYDFSATSPDRLKLLEGICYEWNEVKYPAATQGLYATDASDKPGNEMHGFMNGILSHGLTDQNPIYEGMQDKTVQFGATKFRLDGAAEDYLYDAFQVTLNMSAISLIGIFFNAVTGSIKDALEEFADYALLIEGETCVLPKILIWDGASYTNARAVKKYSGMPIQGYIMPPANTQYNTESWHKKHPAETFVRGGALTLPPFYPGYYSVTGVFGAFEIKRPALLVNYPMYFEPNYEDTMWDWFHWIDDPAKNPRMHMNFTAKMELCCDDLHKLRVFNDASKIALNEKVKLTLPYFQDGRISEIEVSYDHSNDTGAYIQLKGTV
jgi:hypothetical protein